MSGKLVIFSAPSGAGKTTLVKHLLQSGFPLAFSVSATNRPARSGEIDGKDYNFLTDKDFKEKIENNEFLEWEEVYPGKFYGTLKSEVEKIWQKGLHVIFDVDVIGGLNIKRKYPLDSLAVFVMPPSIEVLKERLAIRNTETAESLKSRIDKAVYEISFADEFDKIIINNQLENSKIEAFKIVEAFLIKD